MGCLQLLLVPVGIALGFLGCAALGDDSIAGPVVALLCGIGLVACLFAINRKPEYPDPLHSQICTCVNFGGPIVALILIVGGLLGSVAKLLLLVGLIDG